MRTAAIIALLFTTTASAQDRPSLARNLSVLGMAVVEGAANATMDTIDHHYEQSIFRGSKWWGSEWEYVKARREAGWPTQIADGWHFSKSIQLITWGSMVVTFDSRNMVFWERLLWLVAIGVVRNLSFNLFYNRVLR